jgi:uncharacterized protein
MRKLFCIMAILCFLVAAPAAHSQGIQINRQNRTISVRATEAVEVQPEIAVVTLAYVNFAATQEAAYSENVRVSAKVIQSLLSAGLNKQQIQTSRIKLMRQNPEDRDNHRPVDNDRQFKATQSWDIRVAAAQAQTVVDRAVAAGANQVQNVDWTVADLDALEARANAAALDKARHVAGQMATRLGGKVGELLYASNSSAPYAGERYGSGVGGGVYQTVSVQALAVAGRPILRLFPRKVRQQATVYAVFALE